MKLIDILKQNVRFVQFRNGSLFYETEDGKFKFEVPSVELGDSTISSTEKASLFMKWIKKAFKEYEQSE